MIGKLKPKVPMKNDQHDRPEQDRVARGRTADPPGAGPWRACGAAALLQLGGPHQQQAGEHGRRS